MDSGYHVFVFLMIAYAIVNVTVALPTSVIDEIKSAEKRSERSDKDRDFTTQSFITDQPSLSDWEQESASLINKNTMIPKLPSNLYNSPENIFDDKTITDYEKGFRYGSSKDRLDEALENAVLKSEMYGEPGGVMNQIRLEPRMKRQTELSPEEVMALLALYEQSRSQNNNYRYPWNRVDNSIDDFNPEDAVPDDDENWLDNPVYPHASNFNRDVGPKYFVDHNNRHYYEKRGRWGGFDESIRDKRFMVHKKRSIDPTHQLRYINGPNRNDFYTLSQLLNNQREPNVPVVRRLVL